MGQISFIVTTNGGPFPFRLALPAIVNDANGHALAYVYARETRADADIANVLRCTKLAA